MTLLTHCFVVIKMDFTMHERRVIVWVKNYHDRFKENIKLFTTTVVNGS